MISLKTIFKFDVPGANALGELIANYRSDLELVLRDANINAIAIVALFSPAWNSEPCRLNNLDLWLSGNEIEYDGLLAIFMQNAQE